MAFLGLGKSAANVDPALKPFLPDIDLDAIQPPPTCGEIDVCEACQYFSCNWAKGKGKCVGDKPVKPAELSLNFFFAIGNKC